MATFKEPTKGSSGRFLKENLKTARGRTHSSQLWLQRQLNDPYVQRARAQGYRSRAAYKLKELNDKYKLLKPGISVVDLGAAPGGWSQITAEMIKLGHCPTSHLVAIDILPFEAIPFATCLEGDFLDPAIQDEVERLVGGKADVVLSDMAASSTGHRPTDHLRVMLLVETAVAFALTMLKPGGSFVAKVFQGGTEASLLTLLKKHFTHVYHAKPPASRSESSELYVVAKGFRS